MDIVNTIKDFDTQLFLFLNSRHNDFFDTVMLWASSRFVWIPLYAVFFYLVYRQVGLKLWMLVIAVGILIMLSDQISVHAFKNVFLRYRPCHNLLIQNKVHVNGSCGGTYGFISSHAANTFALATFLFLFFKNRIKYFGFFIFFWAFFVSFSRVYNGVHYPMDIAVGAVVGIGIAIAIFKMYDYLNSTYLNAN